MKRPDHFDGIMIAVIAVLMLTIGAVVARGDQIGINVQDFGPSGIAASRAPIRITFDEPITAESVSSRFTLAPPATGRLQVSGNRVIFQPVIPLQPGRDYQVVVHAGITAQSGRTLKVDRSWSLHVRQPRIVFNRAEGDNPPNLYLLDPAAPDTPQQLTDSPIGVASYDVSPDGNQIVYAEIPQDGAASLFVWNAVTNSSRVLYSMPDALCSNPVWQPEGSAIAFDLAADTGAINRVSRIWILDLATNTAHPLWKDNQQLGSVPRWSVDGTLLAAMSPDPIGLVVHHLSSSQDTFIPTLDQQIANLSPDGRWLTVPNQVTSANGQLATHLDLIDLAATPYGRRRLTPDSSPENDEEAAWSLDSKSLIMVRQPSDTGNGPSGTQLDLVTVPGGTSKPLLTDSGYQLSGLKLSPAGDMLLLQRYPVGQGSDSAGIWLLNLSMRELRQIAPDGSDPNWIP